MSKPSSSFFIVSISGAIGSGKSTLIQALREAVAAQGLVSTVEFFDEPVQQWIDEGWLEAFYANRAREAFGFQMRVLLGQIQAMEELCARHVGERRLLICERSPLDGLHVFAKTLHAEGALSEREYALYKAYAERAWRPDVTVYISTPAEQCIERIAERARKAEDIDASYYQTNCEAYEDAFRSRAEIKYSNSGSRENLEDYARQLIQDLRGISSV